MMDIEKARADMEAKHAAALSAMEAEHAVVALAPLPPKRVQITKALGESAWLTYECATLHDALDIMSAFAPLASYRFKGTYTKVEPAAVNEARTKDKGEEVAGPFVADIDVSQGEGFGPNVTFSFFARVGKQIVKVRCDLRPAGYGAAQWWRYGAAFVAHDRGQDMRLSDGDRYRRGDWRPNSALSSTAGGYVKWGTGDNRSAHFSYQILADYDADGIAGYDVEACNVLAALAMEMHGERKA